MVTRTPRLASDHAITDPAGPPPTTMTSRTSVVGIHDPYQRIHHPLLSRQLPNRTFVFCQVFYAFAVEEVESSLKINEVLVAEGADMTIEDILICLACATCLRRLVAL
jgi:hypothetical protein